MTEQCCCRGRSSTVTGTGLRVTGWIVPSLILIVIPKCPMCLIAAISLTTGVGLSLSMGTALRFAVLTGCLLLMAFLTVKELRRLFGGVLPRAPLSHAPVHPLLEIKR